MTPKHTDLEGRLASALKTADARPRGGYDVVIYQLESKKIVSVIGINLDERQAERRIETGYTRINDRYSIGELPGGTAVAGKLYEGKPA